MSWLTFLGFGNREQQLQEVAQEVAKQARHRVWQLVNRRIATMRVPEARGYVRARASILIEREVDAILHSTRAIKASDRQRVSQLALNMVVRLIQAQARIAYPPESPKKQVA